MLPTTRGTEKMHRVPDEGPAIAPGSWWRLVAEEHPYHDLPAPAHGLVLMAQEVRVIDGEIHTIVLHEHPLWKSRWFQEKVLVDDFLRDFAPEPNGEMLREAEIAEIMGRVQAISNQMSTPPDPMLLLERQKETDAEAEAAAAKAGATETASGKPGEIAVTGKVPAALLPSEDILAAQAAIETRIASFEAQKTWITERTQEIQENMSLVSAYQTEKVHSTLASISQETTRAKKLLANVQTMRLFLGEDMEVTSILEGAGAPSSEPLTFLQRMLYLDEEIIINDLLEGFSDDQMDPKTLTELFSRDFSLVERMLPYERSAAIVRVRRRARRTDTTGMSLDQLMQLSGQIKADERVHILIRDGQRLHMITADEVTSRAERFFPSAEEIAKLFQSRTHRGDVTKEISPSDIEYSDSRAEHDRRALFYKRFLILLWGVHERTDAFGPFLDKGANWLSETVHSDCFRFVHDEEDVLSDGRPSVRDYIKDLNAKMGSGSRILVHWRQALESGADAPAIMDGGHWDPKWRHNISLREKISLRTLSAEKRTLVARAPVERRNYGSRGPQETEFEAKVVLAYPRSISDSNPHRMLERVIHDGILCLDTCRLEDIDHYAQSRAAREHYLAHAHLLNRARAILASEREKTLRLVEELGMTDVALGTIEEALRLWRLGNKWSWPDNEKSKAEIVSLLDLLGDRERIIESLNNMPRLIRGGIRPNGDVFGQFDTLHASLAEVIPLPWVEERIIGNLETGKARRSRTVSWDQLERPDEIVLVENPEVRAKALTRIAPLRPVSSYTGGKGWASQDEHCWMTPIGLFNGGNAKTFESIETGEIEGWIARMLEGGERDRVKALLEASFARKTTTGRYVELPSLLISACLMVQTPAEGVPRAHVASVRMDITHVAAQCGLEEEIIALARQTYAKPWAIMNDARRGGLRAILRLQELHWGLPLSKAWQPTACLSFDPAGDTLTNEARLPCDPRIGWKEMLASQFCDPDFQEKDLETRRQHYADALVAKASEITFLAPAGADELLQLVNDLPKART